MKSVKPGMEGLIEEYAPGKVDHKKEVEVVGDNLTRLHQYYEQLLRSENKQNVAGVPEKVKENITEILSPLEINAFLQQSSEYEKYKHYDSITGLVITQLIHNSCQQGNSNFYVDLKSLPLLHHIGYSLKNTTEQQLLIAIDGNVGNWCGMYSKNSTFTITGNLGSSCGRNSDSSIFNIQGNVGEYCGLGASGSTFNIEGNAGPWFGEDTTSTTFYIKGKLYGFFRNGDRSRNSIFKTSNLRTLDDLKEQIPERNRIIYLMGDQEIVELDYHEERKKEEPW